MKRRRAPEAEGGEAFVPKRSRAMRPTMRSEEKARWETLFARISTKPPPPPHLPEGVLAQIASMGDLAELAHWRSVDRSAKAMIDHLIQSREIDICSVANKRGTLCPKYQFVG